MAVLKRGWSVLLLAAPLAAFAAGAAPAAKHSEASIPFADHGGIRDWRADGSKGIWIEAAGGHWFYASFSSQCSALPSAVGVKFIPEPSGTLSRWSSIRLQHDERCFFRTLQPSDAPPKKGEPTKPDASPAAIPASPMALDLTSPRIGEPLAAEVMPEIVVAANPASQPPSAATNAACGIASIAWSFAHPSDAWREFAPLPADSNAEVCLQSAALVDRVPDALASVRWFQ